MKIKPVFEALKPNEIQDFESLHRDDKSFTQPYMSYILNRKYVFTRYFEVCKVHLP